MITGPIRVAVTVPQFETAVGQCIDGLEDRQAVVSPTADVVDFTTARRLIKLQKQMRYIATVDLISDLFPFVTIDSVLLAGYRAVDNVSQIAV